MKAAPLCRLGATLGLLGRAVCAPAGLLVQAPSDSSTVSQDQASTSGPSESEPTTSEAPLDPTCAVSLRLLSSLTEPVSTGTAPLAPSLYEHPDLQGFRSAMEFIVQFNKLVVVQETQNLGPSPGPLDFTAPELVTFTAYLNLVQAAINHANEATEAVNKDISIALEKAVLEAQQQAALNSTAATDGYANRTNSAQPLLTRRQAALNSTAPTNSSAGSKNSARSLLMVAPHITVPPFRILSANRTPPQGVHTGRLPSTNKGPFLDPPVNTSNDGHQEDVSGITVSDNGKVIEESRASAIDAQGTPSSIVSNEPATVSGSVKDIENSDVSVIERQIVATSPISQESLASSSGKVGKHPEASTTEDQTATTTQVPEDATAVIREFILNNDKQREAIVTETQGGPNSVSKETTVASSGSDKRFDASNTLAQAVTTVQIPPENLETTMAASSGGNLKKDGQIIALNTAALGQAKTSSSPFSKESAASSSGDVGDQLTLQISRTESPEEATTEVLKEATTAISQFGASNTQAQGLISHISKETVAAIIGGESSEEPAMSLVQAQGAITTSSVSEETSKSTTTSSGEVSEQPQLQALAAGALAPVTDTIPVSVSKEPITSNRVKSIEPSEASNTEAQVAATSLRPVPHESMTAKGSDEGGSVSPNDIAKTENKPKNDEKSLLIAGGVLGGVGGALGIGTAIERVAAANLQYLVPVKSLPSVGSNLGSSLGSSVPSSMSSSNPPYLAELTQRWQASLPRAPSNLPSELSGWNTHYNLGDGYLHDAVVKNFKAHGLRPPAANQDFSQWLDHTLAHNHRPMLDWAIDTPDLSPPPVQPGQPLPLTEYYVNKLSKIPGHGRVEKWAGELTDRHPNMPPSEITPPKHLEPFPDWSTDSTYSRPEDPMKGIPQDPITSENLDKLDRFNDYHKGQYDPTESHLMEDWAKNIDVDSMRSTESIESKWLSDKYAPDPMRYVLDPAQIPGSSFGSSIGSSVGSIGGGVGGAVGGAIGTGAVPAGIAAGAPVVAGAAPAVIAGAAPAVIAGAAPAVIAGAAPALVAGAAPLVAGAVPALVAGAGVPALVAAGAPLIAPVASSTGGFLSGIFGALGGAAKGIGSAVGAVSGAVGNVVDGIVRPKDRQEQQQQQQHHHHHHHEQHQPEEKYRPKPKPVPQAPSKPERKEPTTDTDKSYAAGGGGEAERLSHNLDVEADAEPKAAKKPNVGGLPSASLSVGEAHHGGSRPSGGPLMSNSTTTSTLAAGAAESHPLPNFTTTAAQAVATAERHSPSNSTTTTTQAVEAAKSHLSSTRTTPRSSSSTNKSYATSNSTATSVQGSQTTRSFATSNSTAVISTATTTQAVASPSTSFWMGVIRKTPETELLIEGTGAQNSQAKNKPSSVATRKPDTEKSNAANRRKHMRNKTSQQRREENRRRSKDERKKKEKEKEKGRFSEEKKNEQILERHQKWWKLHQGYRVPPSEEPIWRGRWWKLQDSRRVDTNEEWEKMEEEGLREATNKELRYQKKQDEIRAKPLTVLEFLEREADKGMRSLSTLIGDIIHGRLFE